jgi:GTP pyrophosphokinase
MAVAFKPNKMIEYIQETETWYPRLLMIIKKQPEYRNAAWLLAYQIGSVLQTVKSFL